MMPTPGQDSFDPGSCSDRNMEASSAPRLPITMPNLERPVSPLQVTQGASRFRSDFGYVSGPWHEQEVSEYECKYGQMRPSPDEGRSDIPNLLKKAPLNYSSPRKKSQTTRKNPPSYSVEANQQVFDRKPPPPSSNTLPSSKSKQPTKKNTSRIRARPSKHPAVPRAIDVNLSYNSKSFYPDSRPSPPSLSPISFSSSMFQKHVHYYPSRDTIEKELSTLPPITSIFDDLPFNKASEAKAASTTSNQRDRSRKSEEVATAIRNDRITRTAQPSSEESTVSTFKNRPEKPLRINSQFPSQLQLQKQRQQQSKTRNYYPNPNAHHIPRDDIVCTQPLPKGNGITNGIATGIDRAHIVPRHDDVPSHQSLPKSKSIQGHSSRHFGSLEEIPSPQPLPKGNAITSAVATRIDAARPNFVPLEQKEEYDLQLSKQPPPSPIRMAKVEIYPGLSMNLRGAQETSKASERNFVVECSCLICTLKCWCIADAAFVICPGCLVVNPLNETTLSSTNKIKAQRCWGVGLGYTPKTTDLR